MGLFRGVSAAWFDENIHQGRDGAMQVLVLKCKCMCEVGFIRMKEDRGKVRQGYIAVKTAQSQ